jgi:hypothetical protein
MKSIFVAWWGRVEQTHWHYCEACRVWWAAGNGFEVVETLDGHIWKWSPC